MAQRISDEAVEAATGKNWAGWHAVLAKKVRPDWTQKDIASYLKDWHSLETKWAQAVAGAFERDSGRKESDQAEAGAFDIAAQKVIPVPLGRAWSRLFTPEGLALWLGNLPELKCVSGHAYRTADGTTGMVRVGKPPEHIRLTWQPKGWKKASTIQIRLAVVDARRTKVSFHQEQLPDARTREDRRKHWQQVLAALAEEEPDSTRFGKPNEPVAERSRTRTAGGLPADLAAALDADPAAKAAFEDLPTSHRREHVAWIEEAKLATTRARRIAQTVHKLAAGEETTG